MKIIVSTSKRGIDGKLWFRSLIGTFTLTRFLYCYALLCIYYPGFYWKRA